MAQPLLLKRDDTMGHKSEHFDDDKPDTLHTIQSTQHWRKQKPQTRKVWY